MFSQYLKLVPFLSFHQIALASNDDTNFKIYKITCPFFTFEHCWLKYLSSHSSYYNAIPTKRETNNLMVKMRLKKIWFVIIAFIWERKKINVIIDELGDKLWSSVFWRTRVKIVKKVFPIVPPCQMSKSIAPVSKPK